MKEDLKSDIESQITAKNSYAKTIESFSYIIELTEEKYDSLRGGKDSTLFRANLSNKFSSFPSAWFKSRSGNYEGFKSSGKIGFIENKKLKKLILNYYEQQTPGASVQEEYTRSMAVKTAELMYDIDGNGKEIVFNKKLRNYLGGIIMMSNASKENYETISKSAQDILEEIRKEGL